MNSNAKNVVPAKPKKCKNILLKLCSLIRANNCIGMLHRTGYLWSIKTKRRLRTYLQHQSSQPISRQSTFLCSVIVTHYHCAVLELPEQNFPPD